MFNAKEVMAVGFDLDGTLYPNSGEINNRIRNEIGEKILEKKPELRSVFQARNHFEERYSQLHSGSKVLKEVGYEDGKQIMDQCLANADVLDLIEPNPILVGILGEIKNKYKEMYLLTSGFENLANQKLEKIGIDPEVFTHRFYADTPGVGSKSNGHAFAFVAGTLGIPCNNHVYVGDRYESDIRPARNLTMKTIAINTELSSEVDTAYTNINAIAEVLL